MKLIPAFLISIMLFSCNPVKISKDTQDNIKDKIITEKDFLKYYNDPEKYIPGPHHGHALVGSLKYKKGFEHFEYADPDAPAGGIITLASIGTFDSFNPFILKGNPAPSVSLLFESLMTSAADEPSSVYGLIAESLEYPEDNSSVTFKLRKEARWNDQTPVSAEDVIYSFEKLTKEGHPFYDNYYKDVDRAEKTGEREVTFYFKTKNNPELPHIMGQLDIICKHYYEENVPFDKPSEKPPVTCGPYKVLAFNMGKSITYIRDKDYWGWNIPAVKGQYKFEKIHIITFQDANVRFQAFKAGKFDFNLENMSKRWATEYNGEMFNKGIIIKETIPDLNPQGFQGFVFNIRKDIFKDRLVRMAISYAFDFEWSNKYLFFGAYTRTRSFFENSIFASYLAGLPSEEELKLLNPFKNRIPEEVFTQVYEPPGTDGSGNNRLNIKKATELLEKAGWIIKDKKLFNKETNEIMKFEIIAVSLDFERIIGPFVENLKKLGIEASYRTIDTTQYIKRMENFDFDMTTTTFGQSFSPGNEQREFWGSEAADQTGSRNIIGIKNEVIDKLIDHIIAAKGISELKTAVRALDRILLHNYYAIPQWHIKAFRIAYMNKFGKPEYTPPFTVPYLNTWWVDPDKERDLKKKM